MQTIVLAHNHYSQSHLEAVKASMIKLGAPTIRVYDLGFENLCQAIEGCHRLRACEELGIMPTLQYVDSEASLESLGGCDFEGADRACEVGDWENYQISEEDIQDEH